MRIEAANADTQFQGKTKPTDLRQAAQQFESILLMQLTSALNNSSDDSEDNLFGGDAGTGMAKQMFAEQMATTIANSGGIGLADVIVNQMGGKPATANKVDKFGDALAAIKNIKSEARNLPAAETIKSLPIKNNGSLINKTAKFFPIQPDANNSSNDFEVVSTAAEDIEKYGDDLPKPLMGDASQFVFMRPRVVPQHVLDRSKILSQSVSETTFDAAVAPNNSIAAANDSTVSANDSITKIVYQMPLGNYRVSSGFGNRFHPLDHKNKFHAGVDLAAPRGTPIASAAAGKVVFAGWQNGYGNTVVVQHPDGRLTRYGHAEKLFVTTGETVAAGQTIAQVGSTGKSTGSHLHFEIIENNRHLNPLEILAKDF